MPFQILLADDHPIVRQGLKDLLAREGFELIAETSDGREAVRLAQELRPHLAVLDLAMPLLNGLEAAREIVRTVPGTRTILLTVHAEDHYVLEALHAGIRGYVLKTQAATELVQAIKEVSEGAFYLSPGVSRVVVEAYLARGELQADPLSPREREVLQLIAEGKTTREVALALGIRLKTAESHRTRMMEKLDIHEAAGLVRYAIRRGLIQP